MAATTATVITLCSLSIVGFAVSDAIPIQGPGDFPWKDIAGGGAAVLMLAAMFVVLRHLAAERVSQTAERARSQEHVETITKTFGETTTGLFAQHREDSQEARKELQELVRELRRPHLQ